MPLVNEDIQVAEYRAMAASALDSQLDGDFELAESQYRNCVAFSQELRGFVHEDVAEAWINLADFLASIGRYAEAERCYRKALLLYDLIFGKDNLVASMIYRVLAELCVAQGRLRESELLKLRAATILAQRKAG